MANIYRPEAKRPQEGRRRTCGDGFTLMEVLVAIAILAIVVTTILASFNSVFSTTEALEDSTDIYEMAKNTMKRIAQDIESIYIAQRPVYKPPEFDQPPDLYRIEGTTEEVGGTSFAKLRFASKAHVHFGESPRGGVAEIIYYIHAKNDERPVLKRSDNLYPYPGPDEQRIDPVVCKYVKSFEIKYFDAEGTEFDTWDSDSEEYDYGTPKTIRIILELAKKDSSHLFETRVSLPMRRKKVE